MLCYMHICMCTYVLPGASLHTQWSFVTPLSSVICRFVPRHLQGEAKGQEPHVCDADFADSWRLFEILEEWASCMPFQWPVLIVTHLCCTPGLSLPVGPERRGEYCCWTNVHWTVQMYTHCRSFLWCYDECQQHWTDFQASQNQFHTKYCRCVNAVQGFC